MKQITIGNLTFSKKAIHTITFALFCTGILIGALTAHRIKTETNFNFGLLLIFSIPIWLILKSKLKTEIIKKI
jgi:hypothetical protein